MRSAGNPSFRIVLGVVIGALIGFAAPHLQAANAQDPATPFVADENKNECRCEKVSCTTRDGLRNMAGPCSAKCHEGQTASCTCSATCGEGGHVEGGNQCGCKTPL